MLEEHFRHFSSASAMQLSFWLLLALVSLVFIAEHSRFASFYLLLVAFYMFQLRE
jgi:hypothetical protein